MSGDLTHAEGEIRTDEEAEIFEGGLDDLDDPVDPNIKVGLERARTVEFWKECHARMAQVLESTSVDQFSQASSNEPIIQFKFETPRISKPEASPIAPRTQVALLADRSILMTFVDFTEGDESLSFQEIILSESGEGRYTRYDTNGTASGPITSISDVYLANILDRILSNDHFREFAKY